MLKDRKKNVLLLLICILSAIFVNPEQVKAASANVELSSDTYKATVGDEIIIFVNITADSAFGDFEANMIYDEEILEYQSGASFITGSNGFLKIADRGSSKDEPNRKYALKFKVLEVGTCKISFSGRVMVYDSGSGLEMSVSANEIDIEVSAALSASDNAILKSLKMSPSKLTPEFSSDQFEYTTSVENKISKLVINAVPEDDKAKITISGNDLLQEGQNKVVISVLAESGAVIEYTINVNRESKLNIEVPDDVIDTISDRRSFELVKKDNIIYAVYGGKLELVEPDSNVEIPQGYIKTRLIISEISINAFTKEDNLESDFLLIYGKNELGASSFYKYDKVDKTIQRYDPDIIEKSNDKPASNVDDNNGEDEYKASMMKAVVVIALLVGLCAILLIALIRMYMKFKGYKEDELD